MRHLQLSFLLRQSSSWQEQEDLPSMGTSHSMPDAQYENMGKLSDTA